MFCFTAHQVPGITIATDIICGFPGETEADFQETVELVRQYRFPSLFINQFYPRPGTPAAKMEQVPAQVKKQRTKELSQLFHSYNPYDHKIGERQKVLVTEESFDAQYFVAHNKFYEQFVLAAAACFHTSSVGNERRFCAALGPRWPQRGAAPQGPHRLKQASRNVSFCGAGWERGDTHRIVFGAR
ncbi:unnamed protein product [Boreogadus saida]